MATSTSQMRQTGSRQMQAVRSNANISISHAGGAAAAYPAFTSDPDLNEIQSPLTGMKPILDQASNSQFSASGNSLFDNSSLFDPAGRSDSSYQPDLSNCFTVPSSNTNSSLDVGNQLVDISGEINQQNLPLGLDLDPPTAPPWSHLSATQGRNPSFPGTLLPTSADSSQQQSTPKRPRTRSPGSGRGSFRDSAYSTLHRETRHEDELMLDISSANMNNLNMDQTNMGHQYGQQPLPQYHAPSQQQAEFSPSYSMTSSSQQYFNQSPTTPTRNTRPQQRNHLSHNKQQSFACNECEYHAKTRSELNKHNARHQKRFKCTFSDCVQRQKGFPTRNDLDRHLKSVHHINNRQSKDYRCFAKDCTKPDKTWPRLDNFKQHLKSMHKNEDQTELLQLSEEWFDSQNPPSLPPHNDEIESNYQQSHTSLGDFGDMENRLMHFQSGLSNQYPEQVDPNGQRMDSSQLGLMSYPPLDPRLFTPQARPQGPRSLDPRLVTQHGRFQRVHHRRASSPDPSTTNPQPRSVPFQINSTNLMPQGTPMQRTRSQLTQLQTRNSHPMMGDQSQMVGISQTPDISWNINPAMFLGRGSQLLEIPQMREAKRPHTTPDPNLDSNRMNDFMASPIEMSSAIDPVISQDDWLGNMVLSAEVGDIQATSQHPGLVVHPPADEPESHKTAIGRVIADEINHFIRQYEARVGKERSLSQGDLVKRFQITLRSSLDTITNADSSSRSFIGGAVDTEKASHEKDGEFRCTFEGCRKVSKRLSGLKKHLQRHRKPFGCTFDRCSKVFGSKNDWKRHEQSQHEQQECWRCHKCYEVFYHSQTHIINHLMERHGVKRVDEATKQAKGRRIARNYQGQFWCGFCDKIIFHEYHGVEAINHRFDHIADHFKNEKSSSDWIELCGHGKTKAALKEQSQMQSPTNTEEDEDDDDDEAGEEQTQAGSGNCPTSSIASGSSMQSGLSTEQQSLSQYSSSTAEVNFKNGRNDLRPDQFTASHQWAQKLETAQEALSTKSQSTRPTRRGRAYASTPVRGQFIVCCQCINPYNVLLSKSCVPCNHDVCSRCKVGVPVSMDDDETMMM